jgi:cation diffusion facilitator family transporter
MSAARTAADPLTQGREIRIAAWSLALAIVLLAVKAAAWWFTRSTALWSDAVESVVNVIAGGLALGSLIWAARPADESHPYGHGRIEFLSAAFEGGMVSIAALAILFRGIEGLLSPSLEVERIGIGLVLALSTALANGLMGIILLNSGRRHDSLVLKAGGVHLLTDAGSTLITVAALGLVALTGQRWWDAAGALALGIGAAIAGIRLVREAIAMLLDERDTADAAVIERILTERTSPAAGPDRLCSFHKIRHRHVGREHWIDFHVQLPASLDVATAHAIAKRAEDALEEVLPGTATAHVEPCTDRACPRCGRTP